MRKGLGAVIPGNIPPTFTRHYLFPAGVGRGCASNPHWEHRNSLHRVSLSSGGRWGSCIGSSGSSKQGRGGAELVSAVRRRANRWFGVAHHTLVELESQVRCCIQRLGSVPAIHCVIDVSGKPLKDDGLQCAFALGQFDGLGVELCRKEVNHLVALMQVK